MPNYNNSIQKTIKKSFPLLKNHKIIIKETGIIYGARVIYLYFFSIYIIGSGGEKKLSRGGIAHELSHIEIYKKWGFWKSVLLSFLQFFSESIRRKIERGADILAIEKGYRKELYQARKRTLSKANDRIKRLIKKNYLSLKEIKKYKKPIR